MSEDEGITVEECPECGFESGDKTREVTDGCPNCGEVF